MDRKNFFTLAEPILHCILFVLMLSNLINAQEFGGGRIIFGDRVQVNNPDPNLTKQDHPAMVMDDSNHIYVVWQDDRDGDNLYEIYFSKSTDLGANFIPDINVSQNPTVDNVFPWITIDTKGYVYIVWQSHKTAGEKDWEIRFTRFDGTSFTPPDTVHGIPVENNQDSDVNFGPQPKIAVDSRSNPDTTYLYLIWANGLDNEPTQVLLAVSTDLGDNFGPDRIRVSQNTTGVNRHPDIALDDSGYVYCIWERGGGQQNDPHPDIVFNKSIDRGVTFMAQEVLVNDNPGESHRKLNPVITIDKEKGLIYAAWEDSRIPPAQADDKPCLFFARSEKGDSFSINQQINFGSGRNNYRPAISIDPEGTIIVGWHSNTIDVNHYGIYTCGYSDAAGAFTQAQSLINTFTGSTPGPMGNNFYPPALKITVIEDTSNFFLVWQDLSEDPNGNIYCIRGWVEMITAKPNLNSLKVYPNPFKPYAGHTFVNFAYLTERATIRIFDVSGNLVKTIYENDGDGLAIWDGDVASGVYVYCITNPQGEKRLGKIAVIQ